MKNYAFSIILFLLSIGFIIFDIINYKNLKMYMVGIPIILIGIGIMIILNNKTRHK